MTIPIRSHPQLLDASVSTVVGAVHLTPPAGPAPRTRSHLEVTRRVRLLRPRHWHLRHRWEITAGDDAHQLALSCTRCGRVRRSLQRTAVPIWASDLELRRMR